MNKTYQHIYKASAFAVLVFLIAGCSSSKSTIENSKEPLDPSLYTEEQWFDQFPPSNTIKVVEKKSDGLQPVKVEEIKQKETKPELSESAEPELPKKKEKSVSFFKMFSKKEPSVDDEKEPIKTDKEKAAERAVLEKDASEKPDTKAFVQQQEKSTILRSGYMLSFSVFVAGETEISETKRIAENGFVSLPLLGRFSVKGLTVDELAQRLEAEYAKNYFVNPTVEVSFVLDGNAGTVSPWGFVTVLGRVNKSGRVNIPPTRDMTVSLAIQNAGGFSSSAKDTAIRITRILPDGTDKIIKVNLQNVGAKGRHEDDIKLNPGDVVYVPESIF